MTRRRVIAVLALLGIVDSTYLLLHKLGYVGSLVCVAGAGGCDLVNTSPYASLLGVPVAAYGVAGYATLLVVAVVGDLPGWRGDRRPDGLMALLAGVGTAFSLYLTYISLWVIGSACQWCLVSLALITTIFAISVWSVTSPPAAANAPSERSRTLPAPGRPVTDAASRTHDSGSDGSAPA